ncbi:MAG: XTP/dITP diphosphatase, partial [Candidatus Bathyarchaeota archaeon]
MVFFVTENIHKFNEARQVLAEHGIAAARLRVETFEIQDDSIENVAKATVTEVTEKCSLPVIVEDSGLFVERLNGFPGPYSSYVYRTLGTRGILKLMDGIANRNAYFYSVVAFYSPEDASLKCFHGKVEGKITLNKQGNQGFGYDPIFKPKGRVIKTFAEMTTTEKNEFS